MSKVSVIVPVYNVEKYLERCIESIVNQTYKELEIILVDDGSTDSSVRICDDYAKKDSRIKVIHQENAGVSAARNNGIDNATGEYLSFVDSDDYVDLHMIERLMNNLIKSKADISICNFIETVDRKTQPVIGDKIVAMDSNEALLHLYIDKDIGFVILCGKIIRRDLFDGIRLPLDISCGEDSYVMYKLMYKAEKVVYDNSKMYVYFQRRGSATKTFDKTSAQDFAIFNEQMKFWKRENRPDLQRMCFVRCFKRLMLTSECARNAEKSEDFYDALQKEYEKAIKDNYDDVRLGPIEKRMFLTKWFDGKNHKFPFMYIRIKDYIRNFRFLKQHSLD